MPVNTAYGSNQESYNRSASMEGPVLGMNQIRYDPKVYDSQGLLVILSLALPTDNAHPAYAYTFTLSASW